MGKSFEQPGRVRRATVIDVAQIEPGNIADKERHVGVSFQGENRSAVVDAKSDWGPEFRRGDDFATRNSPPERCTR